MLLKSRRTTAESNHHAELYSFAPDSRIEVGIPTLYCRRLEGIRARHSQIPLWALSAFIASAIPTALLMLYKMIGTLAVSLYGVALIILMPILGYYMSDLSRSIKLFILGRQLDDEQLIKRYSSIYIPLANLEHDELVKGPVDSQVIVLAKYEQARKFRLQYQEKVSSIRRALCFDQNEKFFKLLQNEPSLMNAIVDEKASWTTLHYAAYIASREMIEHLLKMGANPAEFDNQKRTPCDIAERAHREREVCDLLHRYYFARRSPLSQDRSVDMPR